MNTEMKNGTGEDKTSAIYLAANVMLANIENGGLADYALKAAIGGAIWLVFKIVGELLTDKFKRK